jgi:quercetin dioxygenase-like cupin family protein
MRDLSTFEYVRPVDFASLDDPDRTDRFIQKLLHHDSGAEACSVTYIATPQGPGSPFGIHVHDFDQVCYVFSGTMTAIIAGDRFEVPAGSLVVFPAGVEHTYDNDSPVELRHLSINAPAGDPNVPHARSVAQ